MWPTATSSTAVAAAATATATTSTLPYHRHYHSSMAAATSVRFDQVGTQGGADKTATEAHATWLTTTICAAASATPSAYHFHWVYHCDVHCSFLFNCHYCYRSTASAMAAAPTASAAAATVAAATPTPTATRSPGIPLLFTLPTPSPLPLPLELLDSPPLTPPLPAGVGMSQHYLSPSVNAVEDPFGPYFRGPHLTPSPIQILNLPPTYAP